MSTRKKIAVLTSGGDAPGMNAAVRGVVRAALQEGWAAYGIRDAYRGLVEGGAHLFPLDAGSVGVSFREGGTFLGSARFTDIVGTSQQAQNLKLAALTTLGEAEISGLVVIGGDGSLTGAQELFAFLQAQRQRLPEKIRDMHLAIAGIPGSIDNDIPCTDMSIGVDTTLNTIVECIDKLRDTATSHKRVSIVEVMGRLRGYLAVMSGLATGSDHIFIREHPVSREDLFALLSTLQESFDNGQQAGIIIRSEGAVFSTPFIKETIATLLEPRRDVRETILGHLQRGGCPTAFERVLAMRLGVKAVQLLKAGFHDPLFVCMRDNRTSSTAIAEVLAKKNAPAFRDTLSHNVEACYNLAAQLEKPPARLRTQKRIAILTDGNNVSGMNMAVRSVARLALNAGLNATGIKGGFCGLLEDEKKTVPLQWAMLEMKSILRRPGSLLGVSGERVLDDKHLLTQAAAGLEKLQVEGLITVGNLRSYQLAYRLAHMTGIPVVGIPADANCNLPGTNWVIGMDSALNDLTREIDRAADAAHVQNKIFIIHLKWHYCYCLVHLAALAGGADQLIIDIRESETEDSSFFQAQVEEKIKGLQKIISRRKLGATVVFFSRCPEAAASGLACIKKTIAEQEIGLTATVVPLETSYGGSIPTAFDRVLAKRFGAQAFAVLQERLKGSGTSFHIVGIKGKTILAHPYKEHIDGIDNGCPPEFVAELQNCFALMSQMKRA
ncbi:MAG: ATP-dependent 6-phosphofructokinase [Deltaproteobacteria bacterium]|nr:ATP-dependent 6-phosphofructokinase [Deltaproteobacteria bacterium]